MTTTVATESRPKAQLHPHHDLRVDHPVGHHRQSRGGWHPEPGGQAVASVAITVAVVLLGFIKGRLIIRYFMEVRSAPQWLKVATDAWLIVLWAAI